MKAAASDRTRLGAGSSFRDARTRARAPGSDQGHALRTTNPPADGPTDTVAAARHPAAVLPMTLVSAWVGAAGDGEPASTGAGSSCGGESHAAHQPYERSLRHRCRYDIYARLCPAPGPLPGPTTSAAWRHAFDEPPAAAHPSVRWNPNTPRWAAVGSNALAPPYGLLCTVLMGKHIDKIGYDKTAGYRTPPVLLAKRARTVTLASAWWLLPTYRRKRHAGCHALPCQLRRAPRLAKCGPIAAPAAATGVSGVAAVVCRVGLAARVRPVRCWPGPGDRCSAARLVIFADWP